MSKSNTFENDFLGLIFNGTAITGLADNAAASPVTSLYVSLHTSDPGETGDQTTSEASYGGYARVAVVRTSAGWTISNGTVANAANVTFPQCTSGAATATHVGVGTLASGTGKLLYKGALTSSLAVSLGIQPLFAAGTLNIAED